MKKRVSFPLKIYQKSNTVLAINWDDGTACDFFLEDLQRRCPCVVCSGRIQKIETFSDGFSLRAKRVTSVGRYGLRIQFTSGCSLGIYPFRLLKEWGETQKTCMEEK